jgi:hypothetical protein
MELPASCVDPFHHGMAMCCRDPQGDCARCSRWPLTPSLLASARDAAGSRLRLRGNSGTSIANVGQGGCVEEAAVTQSVNGLLLQQSGGWYGEWRQLI